MIIGYKVMKMVLENNGMIGVSLGVVSQINDDNLIKTRKTSATSNTISRFAK